MSILAKHPFYTAYTYLNDFFGVEVSEDLFENIAYVAWSKIGNRDSRMYKMILFPEKDSEFGWRVALPCNADIIESVTAHYEDYQKTSSISDTPGSLSSNIETFNENMKFGTNDLYQSGKFIKYRQLGEYLYFTENYPSVSVLYKGIHLDSEGLPYLNDKEIHAIATYCAYTIFYKKALQTKDGSTFQMAQSLKADWNKACSQARVPKYINQNEMNEILDANSSWNRKMFGKSYKPVQ